ncbi:MAG: class I SAM-dependent methyltransferase [Syntrophomonadaceae bacterium]|jgi:2-polyprenyl-3-methyl-5-hydroxy-6-metoxy-1,4-benzoquinol methylase|nr:class I SAM-dependent methyltransferase [Brevefilum fermentans]HQA28501.1 class I SAM-dependent methyltransferase [Brevefilum fermentans]
MKTNRCIICGSYESVPLFKLRDFRLDNSTENFPYYKCRVCGLIFQNPQISPETIVDHYNNDEIYCSATSDKGFAKVLNTYGLKKRAGVVLRLAKSGRLLDVGCGSGSFIAYLDKKSKFQVVGTEINKKHVRMLKNEKGFDVRYGNLEDIGFENSEFDVVTMWDVIEHVNDPHRLLHEIRRLVIPNGYLVIRVPNGDSLDFKLFGKHWAGLDAPRHFYVFNLDTLTQLLNIHGFEILKFRFDIGGYLNAINSLEFFLNDTKTSLPLKTFLLNTLRSKLFQVLFFPLLWIKSLFFQGTSLTVTAINNKSN